ncbi:hypothetical protein TI39_contig900g00009 [Zymoseptoria brevis]|uniref:Uncharacterized protein n=1 Tax=Zymoseptoria brevis TaxID=1047168 RepID=A0A0F4GEQ0_9PEZI|nr:hypothetical protein TI39_contig900g00009 [Zymoseptoria brevis]
MESSVDVSVLAQECAKQAFMRAENTDVKFSAYVLCHHPFAFLREFGMALCDVTVQGFALFVFICRFIPIALRYKSKHSILAGRGFQAGDIFHFDTASEIFAVGIAILFIMYWMAVMRRNMANNRLLPAFRMYITWIAGLSGIPVALDVGWS